jgi:hypothetical protein
LPVGIEYALVTVMFSAGRKALDKEKLDGCGFDVVVGVNA